MDSKSRFTRSGWAVFGLMTLLMVIYFNLNGTLVGDLFITVLWAILVLLLGSTWGRD